MVPRLRTTTVAASPSDATETVVAAIAPAAIPSGLTGDPVDLSAVVDVTAQAAATAVTVKIRRGTDAAGTVLATFGPATLAAASARAVIPAKATDQEKNLGYVVTVTMVGAGGASTVNNINLTAIY